MYDDVTYVYDDVSYVYLEVAAPEEDFVMCMMM